MADQICKAASESVGLDDFGDDWFLGPLRAWATDLEQVNLTDFGRGFLRSLAVKDVARRLRVLDVLNAYPEIASVRIPPIVYITGMERSGTTLLHNLLAEHPKARALLRWELMEPVPPPEAATYASDDRIAAVQASIDKLRGSMLETMHWVNANEPEECVWGFIDATSMLGQAASLCMPHWQRFLSESDNTPAYANYRRVLQLLLWRNPVDEDGFLVLKAPQIGQHIAEFASVFPEAQFVITDRDPFRCITSLAVMGASIIEPFCVANPVTNDGLRDRSVQRVVTKKLAALAAFSSGEPDRVTHVPYPLLVDDPAAAVARAFAGAGIAGNGSLSERIEAFLHAQRTGRRSAPPRELPTAGYEHERVLADPVIADYCRQFAIQPERERKTGS